MPRTTQATQRFAERRDAIVRTARSIAERDGWSAVTVRALAGAMGFSQPILYKHFPRGRDEIVEQVVLQGSAEIAAALETAASPDAAASGEALRNVTTAYFEYARVHPAVVEAVSSVRTSILFASDDTPPALRAAFAALRRCVEVPDPHLSDVRAELLWSVLHGVDELIRSGRLPDGDIQQERIAEIVRIFQPPATWHR